MKKKIILLGSKGFFGINIYNYFKKDFNIKKVHRKTNLEKINFKNYNYLINTAADVYHEEKMFRNNTYFVYKIIKKIVNENKKIKLIHFGSSGEYGSSNKKLSEKHLLEPRTIYEATKSAATMLISGYSKYYKINSIIIRPFAVYGMYENKTRIFPNFFRYFLNLQRLTIYKGFQDYVYIKDLLFFIDKIIKEDLIKNYGEIVNFGSGKQYSNLEIFKFCRNQFIKSYGKLPSLDYSYVNKFNKIYHKKIWCSNNYYLLKKFKFKFKFNIKKGIKDYIWTYLKNTKLSKT